MFEMPTESKIQCKVPQHDAFCREQILALAFLEPASDQKDGRPCCVEADNETNSGLAYRPAFFREKIGDQ